MDLKSKIILISGPTASGKSSFAIKFAKKVNGEIINADSMQIYKELKILSARPDPKKYQKIKHHLYGFHNVTKNFSTGDWLKLVIKKIKEVHGIARGSTVRARNVGRDIFASLKNIVGGEISEYTRLQAESREQALQRMEEDAKKMGANAIINVRLTTSMVMQGCSEILAYGTAVTVD